MNAGAAAFPVRLREGRVRFSVHAQPGARATGVAGLYDGALRIRVQAPPADGAANEALVAYLADALGIPRRAVLLVSGASARRKVFEVAGPTPEQVRSLVRA